MESKKEYWHCFIGPIDRSKVPDRGDRPMRMAVQQAYYNLTGEDAEICSSGWGITKKRMDAMNALDTKMWLEEQDKGNSNEK